MHASPATHYHHDSLQDDAAVATPPALSVRAIMSWPAIVAREDAPIEELARTMLDHRIGGLPIVDGDGRLVGIVTESDFVGEERGMAFSTFRAPRVLGQWVSARSVEPAYRAARGLLARDIMSRPVAALTEDATVTEVILAMIRGRRRRLPVVRDGIPSGMVTRHDVLRLLAASRAGQRGEVVPLGEGVT
jgi:CBS domain-containing protein